MRAHSVLIAAALSLACTREAAAQVDSTTNIGPSSDVQQPAPAAPTPRHTGVKALVKGLGRDVTHLPSKENLIWATVGGGLAAAVHPLDDNVNSALINNDGAKTFFKPGAVLGQFPTLFAAATTVYVVGRTKDEPRVSHVGMDLLSAITISGGVTLALKYATRRERPDGSGKTSFPSGHAADTFAFATALERHLNWKFSVPAYAFASYVAISRLPANRHWLSDVVFGSAVGIIAGRTVTSHEASPYQVVVTPLPRGVEATYIRIWPRPAEPSSASARRRSGSAPTRTRHQNTGHHELDAQPD